jgi:hypothetical protein
MFIILLLHSSLRCVSSFEDMASVILGGDSEEVTPDPIPNSVVKLFCADGTA